MDASYSWYADLINNVGNGGAVLSLLFLCACIALVGIIGKAVGGGGGGDSRYIVG